MLGVDVLADVVLHFALPAVIVWNASVALADYSNGWRVALLAKNLADKSYSPLLASGGNYIYRAVPRDDERYFGVQLRKDF